MMNKVAFFPLSLLLLSLSLPITTLAQSPAAAPSGPPNIPTPAQPPAVLPPAASGPPNITPLVPSPPAGAPLGLSGPPDITKVLEKVGHFTVFLRLLRTTQVANQLKLTLNDSNNGMTVFAPSDNAFARLQAGTLNSLSDQEKVELVQYHVIPSFFTMSLFQTASNPMRTLAGDTRPGQFPLNITTSSNQVNISSGIVNATVDNSIYNDNQLAVYKVDTVLLPLSIFGPHPPAEAPAPAPAPEKKKKKKPAVVTTASPSVVNSAGPVGLTRQGGVVMSVGVGVGVVIGFLL